MSEGIFRYWPNRITAMRGVGAAVLFVLFTFYGDFGPEEVVPQRGMLAAMFWLFLATALSDAVDGYLARRGNQITAFGRIADPFVDKILVLGTLIFMAVMPWSRPWVPAWIVVVILSREILVTALRGYVESLGHEFPADWAGKIKMILQCIAIAVILGQYSFPWSEALLSFWGAVAKAAVYLTLASSVYSGVTYVLRTRDILAAEAAE